HDERTGVSLAMAPWRPPSRRARCSPVPPDGRTKGLLRHRALMLPRDGRIGAFLPMVASVPCLAMGASTPYLAMGARVRCFAIAHWCCPAMGASVPYLAMGARVPCFAMGASVPCLAMGAPAVLAVCMVPCLAIATGAPASRWGARVAVEAGCDCLSRLVVPTACQLDEPPARGFPGSLVARP